MSENEQNQTNTLTPVWERLHEHDRDLNNLKKEHAESHQRIKGTEQVVANVHQELKDWKDQTHRDSAAILAELREANKQSHNASIEANDTAAVIRTFKWVIPTAITGAGVLFGALTFLARTGVFS